ncbi:MAG: protein kinase family protein [Anaerolineae bacterium]|nr:protein kinase family protein [Anaerolineae bacterium]
MDCPAGTLPLLLKYGDMLGKIRIVELLRVLRTGAIYKAELEDIPYLLKVANPGEVHTAYIKTEAETLSKLREKNVKHPSLPTWVPHRTSDTTHPVGIVTFNNQLLYYLLFEYVDGEFLNDYLLDNSQPFHEHAGWYIRSLSEAAHLIHQEVGNAHLNLNPDMMLVVRNSADVPQPLLLDMGLGIALGSQMRVADAIKWRGFVHPSYAPPVLVLGGSVDARQDVYIAGIIMHEMLEGHPVHSYKLRRSEDIFDEIRQYPSAPPIRREDLPTAGRRGKESEPLTRIVEKAVSAGRGAGYGDLTQLRGALLNLYGPIDEKKEFNFGEFIQKSTRRAIIIGMAVMILFVLYMLIVALLGSPLPEVASVFFRLT